MEEMDKVLEDLQKVNVEFNNQLSKYEALIYQTKQTNEKLDKYTDSNRDKVDRLCIRVENKLGEMNQRIEEITRECKGVFELYSVEIASFNAEEREAFSGMLLEALNAYKTEFLQDVLRDYRQILQGFMEEIHKETDSVVSGQQEMESLVHTTKETNHELVTQVHGLRVVVNGCLEAINHTIGSINDNYVTIFNEFSRQVTVLNREEREKFVGEMSCALEKYKDEYGLYNSMLQESQRVNQELARLTLQNVENVREMEQQIRKRLEQTESLMEHISVAYEQGFGSFAKDVSILNNRERENLVVAVRSVLEDYRFTFGNEIESKAKEMNALFQKTLAGVCNNFSAKNQEYQKILESTKESNYRMHEDMMQKMTEIQGITNGLLYREKLIKDALDFLKEDYKNTIWQYVQEIERNNIKDREVLAETAVQNVNLTSERFLHQLEIFRTERVSYIQQMEKVLEEERRDRESMLNRQAEAINILKREQEALKRQLQEKQDRMNLYQMISSSVCVGLVVVCILLLVYLISPAAFSVAILVAIVAVGVGLTVCRKRIVNWMNKGKDIKKN